jgi:hypothetical protein
MIQKKNLRKASCLSIILMLICIAVITSCTATQQPPTILDIITVKGGYGTVSMIIKNIGNSTAENESMTISVKGGILNRINITKTDLGCLNCSHTIEPNATKTMSTVKEGKIIGFGPIIITVSTEAANAERVSKTLKGVVLGFLVVITK